MKDEYLGNATTPMFSASFFRRYRSCFPPVPLAMPYWSGATYRAIVQCLVTAKVVDGPELPKLGSSVGEFLGVEDAVLCGSGSLALEMALRACGVGQRDEVIIPAFCCTAAVAPILAVGAVPVLADVGPELNITADLADAVLTKKTRAMIVPHLFGNPADIGAIIDLVRGGNIHVIDDAAQALGATIDGRPVGSFGAMGILSFGREKVCFGLGGGALVSRRRDLLDQIPQADLSPPRRAAPLRNCWSTLAWHRWRRWTLPLQRGLAARAQDGPDAVPAAYRKERMANLSAAVALALMETLAENLAARRARVEAYRALLGDSERLRLIPHRSGSACLTQVVRVLPRRRADDPASRVIEALGNSGYEIQGSYVPIHLLSGYERCVASRISHAEKIWGELIELPCEPQVTFDQVERIAALVRGALAA